MENACPRDTARSIEVAEVHDAIPLSHRSCRLVPQAQTRGSSSSNDRSHDIPTDDIRKETTAPPLSLCAGEMKILWIAG